MKKRIGKFKVSDALIDRPEFIEVLKQLEFVPYEVQQPTNGIHFEYAGTSPRFGLIEEGSIIPEYNIIINAFLKGKDINVIVRKC